MADTGATTTVPGARSRSRRPSLASKLVWLGTLLTAVVVTLTFAVLSVSVERHTRGLLAETLAQHQTTLQSLERAGLDELLRTSTLMTDSPTLRAAMETFAEEAGSAPSLRPDLLETIQAEADKIAAGLGRDLLVVTDRSGRVLAASGAVDLEPRVGSEFAVHEITRNVLAQRGPVGPRNFAVLRLGESRVRVGCVPILLQGFVIGTLTLGERIDAAFVDRLERSFGCDVAVLAGSEVVTSTLDDPAVAAALRTASATGHESSGLVTLDGQEYVSARGLLGRAGRSEPVELVLLGALSPRLADANRELLLIVVGCGLLALVLSGSAAWWMSRSVLRPLERFVAFMRDVASSGDHARRFDAGGAGVEIETLHEAYGSLMDSLLEHERRLLETSRRELDRLERLKESEKLAALGRMLSGAAHEINNPLTGVVGHIEMLLRGDELTPRGRERLERVHLEARRVAALVRNLLKTSHRDAGEARTVVDLETVLRETAQVRAHDFSAAGIRLEIEPPPEPVRVLGSELQLHQVFLNLVNNAFDALRDSGPEPRLTVRMDVERGRVAATFSDNGPGMPHPKQVFEHFYTTKPVGKGTGLGLSICYQIVQDHGGRIAAENLPDGGARFTVELPVTTEETALRPVAEPETAAPVPTGPLRATVLVVDDEPMIVDLQREILEALGASVVGVLSGREAIEELGRRSFDLILSDVKMPGGVSGEELFRWVESNRPEAVRRFVFTTGDTAGDGSRAFVDRVGARCLVKPFSTDEYVRAVHEACRDRTS